MTQSRLRRFISMAVAARNGAIRVETAPQLRMNAQALYMDRSAIGYTAVPYVVGGTGWVFTADVSTWF
jgi:hypothetical protein